MGQTIEILATTELGETLVVAADRSWSGQDGEAYSAVPSNQETFPAQLAARLFEANLDIDHVYVLSNVVSMRRPGGWNPEATAAASDVISGFFRFYGATELRSAEEPSEGS